MWLTHSHRSRYARIYEYKEIIITSGELRRIWFWTVWDTILPGILSVSIAGLRTEIQTGTSLVWRMKAQRYTASLRDMWTRTQLYVTHILHTAAIFHSFLPVFCFVTARSVLSALEAEKWDSFVHTCIYIYIYIYSIVESINNLGLFLKRRNSCFNVHTCFIRNVTANTSYNVELHVS